MYKLIVCDLDETLLDDEKKICTENIEAIKKAKKKGVKFVPATGRGYTSIDYVLKTLDLYDQKEEYTISNNGAIITENKDFRQLSFHSLSNDIVMQIIQFGLERELCIEVFTAKDIYAFNLNEAEKKLLLSIKPDAILCENNNFDFLEQMKIVKVMYQNTDIKYLASLTEFLNEEIKAQTTISYSSNQYMEFTSNGISKGTALKELAKLLGVGLEETIAIGDNYNDLSMLEEAGISAAVGNALPEIKAVCKYKACHKNSEGAVAEIIEKYILTD